MVHELGVEDLDPAKRLLVYLAGRCERENRRRDVGAGLRSSWHQLLQVGFQEIGRKGSNRHDVGNQLLAIGFDGTRKDDTICDRGMPEQRSFQTARVEKRGTRLGCHGLLPHGVILKFAEHAATWAGSPAWRRISSWVKIIC